MGGGGKLLDLQHTTALRGAAMLMILIGHIAGTFHTVILSPIPAIGVANFMILSGYGLSISFDKNGLKGFWSKKILRVLLPYSFVIIPLLLINDVNDPIKWIMELSGLKTTYWYVDYQIKWYIVFFFTMMFAAQYRICLFSISSILMFFLLPTLAAEQSFAFVVGVVLAKYRNRITNVSPGIILKVAVIFFIIGTLFLALKQHPHIRLYLGTKFYSFIQLCINMTYAISFLSFSCIIPQIRHSWLLGLVGAVAYEIYLLHFPFYGYVHGNLLLAVVLIVVSVIASIYYSKFINIISGYIQKGLSVMKYPCKDI